MAIELFTNLGSTTVALSKTAPVAGTVESWTVASSATFPAVTTAAGTQFHIVDDDVVAQSEVILVTNITGTTWTVTRGAEGTTPVTHAAGFTIVQVFSRDTMAAFAQLGAAQTFIGTQTLQTSDGLIPLSIQARTTANGGQVAGATGYLTEWRDAGGTAWTSVDATGKFTSLLAVEAATVVAGNNLGTAGILYVNKATAATVGTQNQNSGTARWRTAYWNGSVSIDEDVTLQAVRNSTTAGDADLTLTNGRFKAPRLTTTDAAGTAALSAVRGQIINLDGVTANTLMASESSAGGSFTGSAVSDLIIKEPNASSILLGTHGASGVQLPTLKVTSSDVLMNDGGAPTGTATLRSLPRGIISKVQITANQTTITALVDVTGSSQTVTLLAGRRYRFLASGIGFFSTVLDDVYQLSLSLGGVVYKIVRGVSTGSASTTQANSSFCLDATVLCKASPTAPQEIAPGSTVCKLTVVRGGTGTLTMSNGGGNPTEFYIEDLGGF